MIKQNGSIISLLTEAHRALTEVTNTYNCGVYDDLLQQISDKLSSTPTSLCQIDCTMCIDFEWDKADEAGYCICGGKSELLNIFTACKDFCPSPEGWNEIWNQIRKFGANATKEV